jgi:predicted HTH domain antitoxin
MRTLELELPNLVDVDQKYLLFSLASKLYENGKLSLGQAAKMANVSKRTFMELLGDYGVSVFQQTSSDLEDDVRNA